jgi:hypothetical protein
LSPIGVVTGTAADRSHPGNFMMRRFADQLAARSTLRDLMLASWLSLSFTGRAARMVWRAQSVFLVGLVLCISCAGAQSAEREDVRKAINLVTSVKMPFPENLPRNRAKICGRRMWLPGKSEECIDHQ